MANQLCISTFQQYTYILYIYIYIYIYTHTLTGYIAIYQGIIQKKYGHIAFFTMQKINFGRHIALSKPAMYFITNAVQSQLSFPCIAMTPDQIQYQFEQNLMPSCLHSWSTGVTETQLCMQRCNLAQHEKKSQQEFYFTQRLNKDQFIYLP